MTLGNPVRDAAPGFEPAPGALARTGVAPMGYGLAETVEQVEEELDGIAMSIRGFHLQQPDMVLRLCAAYTARLSELSVLSFRQERLDRRFLRLRTMELNVYMDELDRQMKVASRLIEVARQDLAMAGLA